MKLSALRSPNLTALFYGKWTKFGKWNSSRRVVDDSLHSLNCFGLTLSLLLVFFSEKEERYDDNDDYYDTAEKVLFEFAASLQTQRNPARLTDQNEVFSKHSGIQHLSIQHLSIQHRVFHWRLLKSGWPCHRYVDCERETAGCCLNSTFSCQRKRMSSKASQCVGG